LHNPIKTRLRNFIFLGRNNIVISPDSRFLSIQVTFLYGKDHHILTSTGSVISRQFPSFLFVLKQLHREQLRNVNHKYLGVCERLLLAESANARLLGPKGRC
jgi:hypothetical protein